MSHNNELGIYRRSSVRKAFAEAWRATAGDAGAVARRTGLPRALVFALASWTRELGRTPTNPPALRKNQRKRRTAYYDLREQTAYGPTVSEFVEAWEYADSAAEAAAELGLPEAEVAAVVRWVSEWAGDMGGPALKHMAGGE
jgi:hypothetical protein